MKPDAPEFVPARVQFESSSVTKAAYKMQKADEKIQRKVEKRDAKADRKGGKNETVDTDSPATLDGMSRNSDYDMMLIETKGPQTSQHSLLVSPKSWTSKSKVLSPS